MRIGFDLDNTLINYTSLFSRLAQEQGLIDKELDNKISIRDSIRKQHGDKSWQVLQASAYGSRICEAKLFPWALESLQQLRNRGHSLYIISHKTRYSNLLGKKGPDLHDAAKKFLAFSGLSQLIDSVMFLPNQEAKCTAIYDKNCDVFIDDLPEVLVHRCFPASCQPVLFAEIAVEWSGAVFSSWKALPVLLEPERFTGKLLTGGRNSKLLHSEDFVLKYYHADSRDRCRNEWSSLAWLCQHGFSNIPKPLACDPKIHLAIFEYITGSLPKGDEQSVQAMLDFAIRLYELRSHAKQLPPAADAAFCLQDIVGQIEKRIKCLSCVPHTTDIQKTMHSFVNKELEPAFRSSLSVCLDFGTLAPQLRMPSPSDFGLHNALEKSGGELIFLDFEYFGLDDPAKFLADVLLHPGMELDIKLRQEFVARFLLYSKKEDTDLEQRMLSYLPLWKIKWCCILLNEFIVSENQRRNFARSYASEDTKRQQRQLQKAHSMLYRTNYEF